MLTRVRSQSNRKYFRVSHFIPLSVITSLSLRTQAAFLPHPKFHQHPTDIRTRASSMRSHLRLLRLSILERQLSVTQATSRERPCHMRLSECARISAALVKISA
ncbi:hypothetical protein BD769DRAFT_513024 [Suillus cothurnatus]|nr:hypothetical protein BD769DRAFT_513024 [Suillus cothurnatus]